MGKVSKSSKGCFDQEIPYPYAILHVIFSIKREPGDMADPQLKREPGHTADPQLKREPGHTADPQLALERRRSASMMEVKEHAHSRLRDELLRAQKVSHRPETFTSVPLN